MKNCPTCNRSIDVDKTLSLMEALAGFIARPGDVTLCDHCCSVLVFTDGMGLRKITTQELDELPAQVLDIIRRSQRVLQTQKSRNN